LASSNRARYDVWCQSCGCIMKKRSGKFGDFYGCTGYPHCKATMSVRDAALEVIRGEDEEKHDEDLRHQ
jgi:ssDNA-binding Zn-finger/Zn-ribbon topoisomerase 1